MPRRFLIALSALVIAFLPAGAARAEDPTNDVTLDMEAGQPLHYSSSLAVFNVYWDANWDENNPGFDRTLIDAQTAALARSDYIAKAGQYGVPGLTWGGSATAGSKCGPQPSQPIGWDRVSSFIRCEEAHSSETGVPAAGGSPDDFGTGTIVYNVILPTRTQVQIFPWLTSCSFDAFHLWTVSGIHHDPSLPYGRPIYYTVIPTACASGSPARLMSMISHEVVETVTDPQDLPPRYWIDESTGGLLSRFDPLAWPNLLSHGEASDICETSGEFQAVPVNYGGYRMTVASYWSNHDNACAVARARIVKTTFTLNGPPRAHLRIGAPPGEEAPLPDAITLQSGETYTVALLEGTPYSFDEETVPAGPGSRWLRGPRCVGTVAFPADDDATAHATRTISCDYQRQELISFRETGLPDGTPWQVQVNGTASDGPADVWINHGDFIAVAFGAVPGFTLTGFTPGGILTAFGPYTVTATYAPAGGGGGGGGVSYADVIRGDSPVAYWRLGDTSDTAVDSSGNNLDGSYEPGVNEGVPGAVMNDPDTAAEFAGGGVAVPSYFGLDILGRLSVEAWAKGGAQQPYAYLVSKSDWSGTFGYSLYAGPNGTLRFFVGTGSSQITDETGFTWDGQWHHIVGVYDGSTVSLYVDKVLVASTPASGTIASSFGTPLTLGRFNGGGFTFAGDLDEVAIYDHALTNDQIHHHYNQAIFGSIYG